MRIGKTERGSSRMHALRRALSAGLRPLRDAWNGWTATPAGTPEPGFGPPQNVHHPRDATQGPWIIRLWDRIDWYLTLPDARHELYDLKLRRRRFDGLEWRLHLLRCRIRNEPRGLPPGLQPSTNYPGHDELRARISPATIGFTPAPARYDPAANGVAGRHFDPYHPSPAAAWTFEDVGPVPPEQPPQLVFEHIPAAVCPDRDDGKAFIAWIRQRTLQERLVDALLRHRHPLQPHEMPFFDAWPEIPREHASRVNVPLTTAGVPLGGWMSVLWVDRLGEEWRVFRQAVNGLTGYPLGAACTWPVTGENLEWLEHPVNPPHRAPERAVS